jgi:hypothetical protein
VVGLRFKGSAQRGLLTTSDYPFTARLQHWLLTKF